MRSRHSSSFFFPFRPGVAQEMPVNDLIPEAVVPARAEILDAIRRYVINAFRDGRGEGIESDTLLVTSGIVDSAGVLQVIDWLEHNFGIVIEDDAVSAENFDTLDALSRLVADRLPS